MQSMYAIAPMGVRLTTPMVMCTERRKDELPGILVKVANYKSTLYYQTISYMLN